MAAAWLALGLGGCGLDSSPHRTSGTEMWDAKIPRSLHDALAAGDERDLLALLDEAEIENAIAPDASVRGDTGTGVAVQRAALMASAQEPGSDMLDAAVQARAELYRKGWDRVLAALDPRDVQTKQRYQHVPLLFAHVRSLAGLEALAARKEVARLYEDEEYEASLTESLPLINQPAAASAGRTGSGTTVVVLDTGCDYTNSAFGTCSTPGATGCKVAYAADMAPDDGSLDDNGHGTNVSAIVLGVAPGARVVALDVFQGGGAPSSAILSAIDWSIQHKSTYNIVGMNMSLGGGLFTAACPGDVFATAVANARAAGILSAIASGNNGSSSSIASPGCVPAAISVGAVYDANVGGLSFPAAGCSDSSTAADRITCFSNSASFLSMLAPGAMITAGGHTMAGTSQASPHVAGAIAVLRAAFPSEAVDTTASRLTDNGPALTDSRNGVSKHRLDLQAALTGGAPADTTGPTGSVTINGDAAATKTTVVTLAITGSDPSGVSSMCISNTTSCTTFAAFATSKSWTLATGDGTKTVYVKLKDGAGNVTALSDTIVLDTKLPTGGALTRSASDAAVSLSWSGFTDSGGSGIAGYRLVSAPTTAPASCSAGSLLYNGSGTSYAHGGLTNGSTYGYRVCAVDAAGNVSAGVAGTARPVPETAGPTGTVQVNGGAAYTRTTAVTLALGASDASGVSSMCISNTTSCTSYVAFATSKSWTLGKTAGSTSVNVWFKDGWGNVSASPATATISVDSAAPTMGTLTTTGSVGQIALSWTAATDAVSGVSGYKLVFAIGKTAPASCSAGTVAYSGSDRSYTHSALSAGSYSYRLCAIDAAGNMAAGIVRTVTAN